MKEVSFTVHSFFRVKQRLNLDHDGVAAILNNRLAVPLGREAKTNRLHLLFYSPDDDDYFVAVKDEATGEIVTILPHNYHNSWPISAGAFIDARDLIRREIKTAIKPAANPEDEPAADQANQTIDQQNNDLVMIVLYFGTVGGKNARVVSTKVSRSKFLPILESGKQDPELSAILSALITRKGRENESCLSVNFKKNGKGPAIHYPFEIPQTASHE